MISEIWDVFKEGSAAKVNLRINTTYMMWYLPGETDYSTRKLEVYFMVWLHVCMGSSKELS